MKKREVRLRKETEKKLDKEEEVQRLRNTLKITKELRQRVQKRLCEGRYRRRTKEDITTIKETLSDLRKLIRWKAEDEEEEWRQS